MSTVNCDLESELAWKTLQVTRSVWTQIVTDPTSPRRDFGVALAAVTALLWGMELSTIRNARHIFGQVCKQIV